MSEHKKRANARKMLSRAGYKAGGHFKSSPADKREDEHMIQHAISEHESALHKGQPKTRLKLADGGIAEGAAPRSRADRKGRGKTVVNVIVGGQSQPKPVPVPVPVGGPPAPPAMPMVPPGAGAGPAGPGGPMMPPPGANAGGRYKRGGKVKTMTGFEAGAGGGMGRLEKAKDYGANTGFAAKVPAMRRKG